MSPLKRIVAGVFLLVPVLATLAFMLENQQPLSLRFMGWVGPELPVSLIMVLALLFGMLIGPLIGWLFGRSSRASRKRLA
ncbi:MULTISPECIES: LapA family protein [Pseudomonas]|uniref:LapA family protein n=1 Tax=Pseudomonas ekonensis TaxID=2842353 RepID=A0ABS6PA53_9PSED|nr:MULTISPECIES: LapA family protein [Pseudomonas]MBV4457353.1 LapA family protein [Pseudomonas ekonensis]